MHMTDVVHKTLRQQLKLSHRSLTRTLLLFVVRLDVVLSHRKRPTSSRSSKKEPFLKSGLVPGLAAATSFSLPLVRSSVNCCLCLSKDVKLSELLMLRTWIEAQQLIAWVAEDWILAEGEQTTLPYIAPSSLICRCVVVDDLFGVREAGQKCKCGPTSCHAMFTD